MILLECCQSKEPIENPPGQAETIRNRVKEDFSSKLYDRIVELKFEHLIEKQLQVNVDSKNRLTISNLQTKPELLNTFILDSCLLSKKESPVREKNGVSNFLIRLVDAFRGAGVGNPIPTVAVTGTKKTQQAALRELAKKTEGFDKEASPPNLYALHIAEYIINKVIEDARKETKRLQEEHKKRHKDSSTFSIPIQELTHTPQLIGANYIIDFAVAHTPISASIAPSVPIFNSASLNTMTISWNPPIQPSLPPQMTLKDDVPVILGYHIEYRGNGRACHNNEWKRARAHQVLTYEAVVREGEQPPTTLKVYGLTSDTAYRFRVRARTAGGWGPFSEITPPFRTKSMVLIDDYLSLVTMTATADNPTLVQSVRRIITLMKRRMEVREIQYLSLLQLVKMTTMPDSKNSIDSMIVAFDIDTVQFLIDTMQRFDCDPLLLEQGCRLLGFLAMDGPLRRSMFQLVLPCPFVSLPFSLVASLPEEILNRKKMKLIVFLKQIHTKYQISVPSTSAAAEWALQMFHQLRPKKKLGSNAAAMRIQGLYRRKKAQELMRTLAFSVFQRIRDPMSGMTYFYNTKTGESTWTQPKWMV
jgi:hypothetical protein